jgi:hypothetical protein
MPALPWVKWFPKDWLGDAGLIRASLVAKGAWMEALMHILHDGKYEMTLTADGWARLWGVEIGVAKDIIKELKSLMVTPVEERSTTGEITLISRRALKDAIRRIRGRMRKAKYDHRKPSNDDVRLLERLQKRLGNVRGNSQITPDTQMLRCSEAQKLRSKQTTTTPAPGGAALNGGAVWARWVDANRAAGNPDPVPDGPDVKAAQRLAKLVKADEVVTLLESYLGDRDAFIVKQGHALRLMPGRINAYRNPPEANDPYRGESPKPEALAAAAETEAKIASGAASREPEWSRRLKDKREQEAKS